MPAASLLTGSFQDRDGLFRYLFPSVSYVYNDEECGRFLCRKTVHNILQTGKEGRRLKGLLSTCLITVILLAGCNAAEKPLETRPTELPVIDRAVLEEVKGIAKENRRVDEVTAVALKDELYVGLKVTNFNRFFLRSIRKDVHGRLKDRFSDRAIHVTTDSKLFGDISRLERRIREDPRRMDRADLKRKLYKIHEDMKG